jgi:hypothetical protein
LTLLWSAEQTKKTSVSPQYNFVMRETKALNFRGTIPIDALSKRPLSGADTPRYLFTEAYEPPASATLLPKAKLPKQNFTSPLWSEFTCNSVLPRTVRQLSEIGKKPSLFSVIAFIAVKYTTALTICQGVK